MKRGRPESTEDKKTVIINARILKQHVDAVDEKAREAGQTRTDRIKDYFKQDAEN